MSATQVITAEPVVMRAVDAAPQPPLRLVVDGIIYRHQIHGGINTYFNEVLPLLANRPDVEVELLVPSRCVGTYPSAPVRALHRDWLPAQTGLGSTVDGLMERVNAKITALRLRSWERCVFVSTFVTWTTQAVPHVAMALDLTHEIFAHAYGGEFGRLMRARYRDYLSNGVRILAISHQTKRDVVRVYGLDPGIIDVVHLAVNRSVFRPDRNPQRFQEVKQEFGIAPPYVLYVGGRCTAYKNFDGLVRGYAASPVREQAMLVVVGRPWTDEEMRLLKDCGVEGRVRLVANPSLDVLCLLYGNAEAFVYPSRYEGFGLPLLEAMACGTMVLASQIPVFQEVAGSAAVYFNPDDAGSISKALEAAFDPVARRDCIERGWAQLERYSWQRCADESYAVYRKALEAPR
jgi:glycosyltransferase involved in cell wall biosynthesis